MENVTELLDVFMQIQNELRLRHTRGLLLGIPSLMIYHPDDIETLLGNMNNIKKGYEYFSLKPWLREGLLLSDGEKWKSRRKLLTPTFHFQILEGNVRQVFQHSSTFASRLVEAKQPLEDLVRSYTLDVICETAMGVKLNAQENKAESYVRAIKRASRTIMERILKLWLKKEWLFKLTQMGKQFEEDLNTLHGFTEKVIEERRGERTHANTISEKKGKRKAFLDILIEEHEENSGTLTALDIREEVDTFMFEGHDTTSAAICFALYCLANHPEVQEQVYEEQKRIFGAEEREPTLADLQEMNYLEMVIKEVLRLYPPVPFISRMLSKDTTFGGVELAAGTHVSLLPFLVHRHPDFWDDPDEFKPERFLSGTTRHPYSYIPFSAGPRNCIGMKFAMLELKTTLSTVVRNCDLEPISTSLKLCPIIILKTIDPIKIRITPKKNLNK